MKVKLHSTKNEKLTAAPSPVSVAASAPKFHREARVAASKNANMKTVKHGIEPRFGKGRKLRLLSYAVWQNGNCTVSHAQTRGHTSYGYVEIAYKQEQRNNPTLPII